MADTPLLQVESLEVRYGAGKSTLMKTISGLEGAFAGRVLFAGRGITRLRERQHQMAGTMSGGEQQMLAIARALMSRPKLLLLDEPSLGRAPLVVKEIFSVIRSLKARGVTILLVERAYVLETGRITIQGRGADLRRDPKVRATYLGEH